MKFLVVDDQRLDPRVQATLAALPRQPRSDARFARWPVQTAASRRSIQRIDCRLRVGGPVGDRQLSGIEPSTPAFRRRIRRFGRRSPTHWSRSPFSQRTTGVSWNLTFAHAAEKVSDSDSSRSQVAGIDWERIPAERLHPKTAYSRCGPKAARCGFLSERPVPFGGT